jgi:surface protein
MLDEARKFNQPLGSWDVSAVTDMSGTFAGASEFNQSLDSWDISNVTNMFNMFYGASNFSRGS